MSWSARTCTSLRSSIKICLTRNACTYSNQKLRPKTEGVRRISQPQPCKIVNEHPACTLPPIRKRVILMWLLNSREKDQGHLSLSVHYIFKESKLILIITFSSFHILSLTNYASKWVEQPSH